MSHLPGALDAWPHLQAGLQAIGAEKPAMERFEPVLQSLPWTSAIGVEWHHAGRLDLGWRMQPSASVAEQCWMQAGGWGLPEPLEGALRCWSENDALLQAVSALWGEWDLDGTSGPAPVL